jgi:hypothetical protein
MWSVGAICIASSLPCPCSAAIHKVSNLTLINAVLSDAGTSLALVESLIGAEQAVENITDPEKRQQMLDSLGQAWEYAKGNPGKAGFEAAWAIVKSTAADVWELGGDTMRYAL